MDVKLNDISDFIIDCEHKTAPIQDFGYPSIRTPNIGRGNLLLENVNRVSEVTYKEWTKRGEPQEGDLIIAREAPVGNVAIIPKGLKVCLGQRTVLVRPNKNAVDPQYLCYLLLGEDLQSQILTKTTGATVPHLNMKDIRDLRIPLLPSITTQQKIASILSAYDELIENNKQRIKLLEEMAEEIYKEWFVRFRFPGYESTTFFDTQGKEVPHGTVGALPEGWENGTLGEMVSIKKGQNITSDTVIEGSIPVVAGGLQPAYYHNKANSIAPCITVSASGANAGFVNIYYQDIWASDCSVIDSTSTENIYFFFLTLKTRQVEVTSLQKGSAQPHVYPKDLMGLKTSKPQVQLIEKFEDLITSLFKEVALLNEKNQLLQQTRDLLLPRLISGKLSVEHLIDEPLAVAAEPTPSYHNPEQKRAVP